MVHGVQRPLDQWILPHLYHEEIRGSRSGILRSLGGTVAEGEDPERPIAALIDAGNGSIMLEQGGVAAATRRIAAALSRDGSIAIILHPFMGLRTFSYVQDGTNVSAFNIDAPGERWGSRPDLLIPGLTTAGLLPVAESDWDEDEDEEDEDSEQDETVLFSPSLQAIGVAEETTGMEFTRQSASHPQILVSFPGAHFSAKEFISYP
jgi:hypothetical protein